MKVAASACLLALVGLTSCIDLTDGPPVTITAHFYDAGGDNYIGADSLVLSRKDGRKVLSRHRMECSDHDASNPAKCIEWMHVLDAIDFDSVIVEGYVSRTVFCRDNGGYGRTAMRTPSRDIGYLVHLKCLYSTGSHDMNPRSVRVASSWPTIHDPAEKAPLL